jgi:alkanesulfonate monooxygenase SsuD/methylene tetrahydromethanopterin reductase-like flavin-dependent oxidoreductase (luciferase family)
MKVLWRDEISEYHGRYIDFPALRCYPKPASKPHPPILIGSINNPRALKRVAEWGDGWIPVVSSVDEFAEGVAKIKAMAKEAGRDPGTIDFTVFGLAGQWQSPAKTREFEKVGADRVVLWLGDGNLKVVLSEMERLAKAVLA